MGRLLVSLLFSGLIEDALKIGAGVVLAVALALAFAVASLAALLGGGVPGTGIGNNDSILAVPPSQQALFQEAASACDLPWQVLAAITRVEGIGDGTPDPAVLARAAEELCEDGGRQDLRHALVVWTVHWGQDAGSVDQVLATAAQYGYVASGSRAVQVLDLARAQLGIPYLWGGASPRSGFDCSGLVQWIYGQLGVVLPRTAQQQFDATSRLAAEDLEPGDLAFFQICCQQPDFVTHVGIYTGNGRMIHAPTEGEFVREEVITTPYWRQHWVGAGRVLTASGSPPR